MNFEKLLRDLMSVADALKKHFYRNSVWITEDYLSRRWEINSLSNTQTHKPGSRWIMPDFLGVSIRHDTSSFYLISCARLSIHELCIGRGGRGVIFNIFWIRQLAKIDVHVLLHCFILHIFRKERKQFSGYLF